MSDTMTERDKRIRTLRTGAALALITTANAVHTASVALAHASYALLPPDIRTKAVRPHGARAASDDAPRGLGISVSLDDVADESELEARIRAEATEAGVDPDLLWGVVRAHPRYPFGAGENDDADDVTDTRCTDPGCSCQFPAGSADTTGASS